MKKNFLGLILITALLGAAPAHALEIGVLGGLNFANDLQSGGGATTGNSAKTGYAVGPTVNLGLLPELSLEIDALYSTSKYGQTNAAGIDVVTTTKAIEVPILVRYWFIPFASLGVGPYFSFAQGDIVTTAGPLEVTTTYDSQFYTKMDAGAAVSVNVSFPIASSLHLVADARYLLGLKNLAAGSDAEKVSVGQATDFSVKHRALEIFAGLSFAL
jgi:hypothetical protein